MTVMASESVLEILFLKFRGYLPQIDTINSLFQTAQLASGSSHLVIGETYNKKCD